MLEHGLGRFDGVGIVVLIREVDDLADARLHDYFDAFVTGKKRDIDAALAQIGGDGVQDRVQFGVANVGVFAFEKTAVAAPGHVVVGAAARQAVVADADDAVLVVDDAGPDLGVRVFAALRRQEGHSHEVFIPRQIIAAFH